MVAEEGVFGCQSQEIYLKVGRMKTTERQEGHSL